MDQVYQYTHGKHPLASAVIATDFKIVLTKGINAVSLLELKL